MMQSGLFLCAAYRFHANIIAVHPPRIRVSPSLPRHWSVALGFNRMEIKCSMQCAKWKMKQQKKTKKINERTNNTSSAFREITYTHASSTNALKTKTFNETNGMYSRIKLNRTRRMHLSHSHRLFGCVLMHSLLQLSVDLTSPYKSKNTTEKCYRKN